MKVLFVSQCTKNAINETRRIIDQFAERKGDFVWETNITEQGLETVKKLLKMTARKNTAVACHLFHGRLQTELVWIVGNARKFSREGNVPTNVTAKDILRSSDENGWNTGESIAILAALAGLFHDFGKANDLFQKKLKSKKPSKEPFRHEWISLLLFKELVKNKSDKEWLEKLLHISEEDEMHLLNSLPEEINTLKTNPLKGLPPLAKFIGWLILSHHRLPVYPIEENKPRLDEIDRWIDSNRFSAVWNSLNCEEIENPQDIKGVRSFSVGTPVRSATWRFNAHKAATRALKYYSNLDRNWFQDRFSMHMARAALMLSDHCYSAAEAQVKFQDNTYKAYANTEKHEEKQDRILKQKLDEHNVGVARGAYIVAKNFPTLRETLPSITRHKGFKKRTCDVKFAWQDNAFDLACGLKHASVKQGFFGINLASTGCGKTLGNARIMYGLSNEALGCRFCIALGLRVLTLQTGDALQEKLSLQADDLAVLIGSSAYQKLYAHKKEAADLGQEFNGSESTAGFFEEHEFIRYEGSLDDGYLGRWLRQAPKLHRLLSAPILVSTIDHLISATEGCRGGKQIAPILRLLTSDLVLDEPDDFDVADLPALCRLVNFAGVFGARVLLSSATLAPSIIEALFDAYASGRKAFNKACGNNSVSKEVCCAWFDEFEVVSSNHSSVESYMSHHREFIKQRVGRLEQQPVLRQACLTSIPVSSRESVDVRQAMAEAIRHSIYKQHEKHHQNCPQSGKKVSIGLVRMANINEMVAVLQCALQEPAQSDHAIHFCAYHSRFPLLIRSKIEHVLDHALTRHDPHKIWKNPQIATPVAATGEMNHIFVVFATSVAEVGRDHDYDWAIVEPSSMRSIIQLAGRVQRHRQIPPSEPNVVILENNLKGLKGCSVAYTKPGFESTTFALNEKNLSVSLQPFQYEKITSIPRISPADNLDPARNLSDLEHARLQAELLGSHRNNFHASLWWKHDVDWCGEMQYRSRFRSSYREETEYFYCLKDAGERPVIYQLQEDGSCIAVNDFFDSVHFIPAKGIYPWIMCDVGSEIEQLAAAMDMSFFEVSRTFATITLETLTDGERWSNDPHLGFYQL